MKTPNLVDLQPLAYLRAGGADALDFLQGQLSNDVRAIAASHAQISSYNSAKGRMLAVLHLLPEPGSLLIELHGSIAQAVLKRLRMFVLRSKVTLEPATPDLRALGLMGDGAAEALAALGLPAPSGPLECLRDGQRGELLVTRRLGESPRYSITGPADAIEAIAAGAGPVLPFDAWRRADIEAGIPVIYPQTSDHFVPQMANLDLLGGISYDKGCYTGQEIVARLHYLGQVKRRLHVCRIDGEAPPPGSAVLCGEAGESAGEIVDAVSRGNDTVASVVLQLSQAQRSDLRLESGQPLQIIRSAAT